MNTTNVLNSKQKEKKKKKPKDKAKKKRMSCFPSFLLWRNTNHKSNKTTSIKSKITSQRYMVRGHEDIAIDDTSQTTTNKRSKPIDPVVMVVTTYNCRPK